MAKAKAKKTKAAKGNGTDKAERHSLTRRDCKLPRSLAGRVQDHGDEPISALDVKVSFEISDAEACTLAKEKYFTRGLFLTGGRGKPDRPLIPSLTIKLETIESARVSLYLGPNAGGEFKLGACKLKSPELVFDTGRKITITTLVQATPSSSARVGDLWSRLSTGAQIAIEYEHNAEQLEAYLGDSAAVTKGEHDEFEEKARAQVDAFKRGTVVDDGEGDRAETH